MLPENRERKLPNRTTIEFCGTPFAARHKFLVHNAIEDMVAERIGEKIGAYSGISSFSWPTTIDENTRDEYFEQMAWVQKIVSTTHPPSGIFLIRDGAFASMTLTEVSKRAGLLSSEEARSLTVGLLPYAKMEDLIILTLVRPRAALVRELYPKELEGHDELMRKKFIFFSVFNKVAEEVLAEHRDDLPRVEVIKPTGDDFQREEIFFNNANLTFKFLELPTIEEWTEILKEHPEKRAKNMTTIPGSTTLAGLGTDEIKEHLKRWDLSKDPVKRARSEEMTRQIIEILKQQSLLPGGEA